MSKRINTVHESLKGIQMIKLNAWAFQARAKICQARSDERYALLSATVVNRLFKHVISDSPLLLAALKFEMLATATDGKPVNHSEVAVQVFTGLILLNDIFRTFETVVAGIEGVVAGILSWRRAEAFVLNASPFSRNKSTGLPPPPTSPRPDATVVEMRGICIRCLATAQPAPPLLLNVDLSIRQGELVVIHGAAGLGKSMLLAANREDLSAVQLLHGSSKPLPPDCRVAYCSQDPWLQTLSTRDNILFGTAFDEQKYWTVVDVCGLLEDLSVLPQGDATIVGPRGINLSSGQSARIALARACYADADLYLLDCPLANVDAVVQSEIFRKCVVELLLYKTVVIVTHNPEYIGSSFVDQLVEIRTAGVHVLAPAPAKSTRPRWSRRLRDRPDKQQQFLLRDRSLVTPPLPMESHDLIKKIESSLESKEVKEAHPAVLVLIQRSGHTLFQEGQEL